MEEEGRRTRSQAAPEWTVQESVILVNEMSSVEREWSNTLSSFQKWEIIAENCLLQAKVNRGLNQCRRKWESLLADYTTIQQWESKVRADWSYWSLTAHRRTQLELPHYFDTQLFNAIRDHLKALDLAGGGSCDSDSDSDPEPHHLLLNFSPQSSASGSKKKMRTSKRNRGKTEKLKGCRHIKVERCNLEEKVECIDDEKTMPREEKEQTLTAKLRENAELINAILEGMVNQDVDYKLPDKKNVEAVKEDLTRRQSDSLIVCLGNIANALYQLSNLVQEGS